MAASTQNDAWPHISPTTIMAFQTDAAALGAGNAYYCSGMPSVNLQVKVSTAIAFNGTVTFEGTVDETNWVSLQAVNIADGTVATSTTASGVFVIPLGGGLSQIRVRVSTYVAGSVTATGRAAARGSRDISPSSVSVTGNVTVIQATHDSLNLNANLQVANADNSATNPAFVQQTPTIAAATSLTPHTTKILDENKVQIKATQGAVYSLHVYNPGAALAHVQVFFLPSASVTLGTTVPDIRIPLPAGAGYDFAWAIPLGGTLASGGAGTGLTWAATTTIDGNDAPPSDCWGNVWFK